MCLQLEYKQVDLFKEFFELMDSMLRDNKRNGVEYMEKEEKRKFKPETQHKAG